MGLRLFWIPMLVLTAERLLDTSQALPDLCNPAQIRCYDGHGCYDVTDRCNRHVTCQDASDEWGCRPGSECPDGGKTCTPGSACIAAQTPCPAINCSEGLLSCLDNLACYPSQFRCNGFYNCFDGSDEHNCSNLQCPVGFWACADLSACISSDLQCNGQRDCIDGSDEKDCVFSCGYRHDTIFECMDGLACVDVRKRCDEHQDCADGSDEWNCIERCPGHYISCLDRSTCVHNSLRCDGHKDCFDNSDEQNCDTHLHGFSSTTKTIIGVLSAVLILLVTLGVIVYAYNRRKQSTASREMIALQETISRSPVDPPPPYSMNPPPYIKSPPSYEEAFITRPLANDEEAGSDVTRDGSIT